MTRAPGSVIVAPNVLVSLVALALREIPGVARLGAPPRTHPGQRGEGVALQLNDAVVRVDCYVIAATDATLVDLGIAVQATVAAVIQELAGMSVREVNVYIQDVEASNA